MKAVKLLFLFWFTYTAAIAQTDSVKVGYLAKGSAVLIAPGEIKILKENEPVQVLPTDADRDYLVVFKDSTFGIVNQIDTKGVFFSVASQSIALKGGPPKPPSPGGPIGAPKPLQVPRPVAPRFRPVNEAAVKLLTRQYKIIDSRALNKQLNNISKQMLNE